MATPRTPSKRVRLNREALTQLGLAIADGFLEVGKTIIEVAEPPDSPLDPYPLGEGLVKQGGVLVFVDGKKVAGWSQRGLQPKTPKAKDGATAERQSEEKHGITALVGWGFPGRLVEGGTLKNAPNPFGSRAVDSVAPHAAEILRDMVAPTLAKKG
jgi:hypothetical protein